MQVGLSSFSKSADSWIINTLSRQVEIDVYKRQVYINKVAVFLPNKPISNEEMEAYIGLIGGKPSKVRSIVLRQQQETFLLLPFLTLK